MTDTTTEAAPASFITPKDFADMVDSDAKTVRRFLRSVTTARAEKGGRWEIGNDDVPALLERWANRAKATKFEMKTDAEVDASDEEVLDDVDELEDIDEL